MTQSLALLVVVPSLLFCVGCSEEKPKPKPAAAKREKFQGGDYLNTALRAGERAREQLDVVQKERLQQKKEELEFSKTPAPDANTTPEPTP